jgi:hypothetical protein
VAAWRAQKGQHSRGPKHHGKLSRPSSDAAARCPRVLPGTCEARLETPVPMTALQGTSSLLFHDFKKQKLMMDELYGC